MKLVVKVLNFIIFYIVFSYFYITCNIICDLTKGTVADVTFEICVHFSGF